LRVYSYERSSKYLRDTLNKETVYLFGDPSSNLGLLFPSREMGPRNTGVRTYTISDMLNLRPAVAGYVGPNNGPLLKEYLSVFRTYVSRFHSLSFNKDIGLLDLKLHETERYQTAWRFVSSIPNKEFKRKHLRAGNSVASLKSLPRYPTRIYDSPSRIIGRHLQAINNLEKRLSNLRQKLRVIPTVPPAKEDFLFASQGRVFRKDHLVSITSNYKSVPSGGFPLNQDLAVKIIRERSDEVRLSVLGGLTFPNLFDRARGESDFTRPPPVWAWGKYWYFYRKRGRWRVSEHHQRGDEDILLKEVIPDIDVGLC
jgi:hypothetical protein